MKRYRPGAPPPGAGSRGFTLLEVLLAFVVFAISFAVVLEIIAGSMRSTVRAKDYSEAALLAQSLMETIGNEVPLETGSYNGETDEGFIWTIEISDFQGVGDDVRVLELAEMNNAQLYWVDLNLAWGTERRQREASFTTIRSVIGDGR
jgi:general secretion pathway protein I